MREGIYILNKLFCLLICCLLVVRCDFKKDRNEQIDVYDIIDSTRVSTHKDEARLLVSATKRNLEVMELLKLIQTNKVDTIAKKRTSKLVNIHINILNYYTEIAQKNLISIPKFANLGYDTIIVDETTELLKYTDLLVDKIDQQLELTNQIVSTSRKSDFKVMAFETREYLKQNLKETQLLLDDLTDSL